MKTKPADAGWRSALRVLSSGFVPVVVGSQVWAMGAEGKRMKWHRLRSENGVDVEGLREFLLREAARRDT